MAVRSDAEIRAALRRLRAVAQSQIARKDEKPSKNVVLASHLVDERAAEAILKDVDMDQIVVQRSVTPPTAPVLSVTADSSSQLRVALATPSSASLGVSAYTIERSANGATGWTAIASGAQVFGSTGYPDAGLGSGESWYYRANATDPSGRVSSYSPVAMGTTLDSSDALGPTQVLGITASRVSPTQADISWDPAADMRASGAPSAAGLGGYQVLQDDVVIATKASIGGVGLSLPIAYADIGAPTTAGTAIQSGRNWTLTTYGGGITGASDQFSMLYGVTTGDCFTSSIVPVFTHPNDSAKNGSMIRQSLAPDAPFVHVCAFPQAQGKGVGFRYRLTPGADAVSGATLAVVPSGATVYTKLQRIGSTFFGYYSLDGKGWIAIGSISVTMTGSVYVGQAVSSITGLGALTCTVNEFAIQNLDGMTHSVTTLSAGQTPAFRVVPFDVSGTLGASSVAVTASGSIFPDSNPSYVPAQVKSSGYGMQTPGGSGRHLTTPATTLYEVIHPSLNPSAVPVTLVGTRHYTCSHGYYLSAPGPKYGVYTFGGNVSEVISSIPNQGQRWSTTIFHVAPDPGVHIMYPINWWAADAVLKHRSSYVNPANVAGISKDQLDSTQLGGYQGNSGSRIVDVNGEDFGGFDEVKQWYGVTGEGCELRCLISSPYQKTGRPDDPHGYDRIVGDDNTYFSSQQCMGMHYGGREPFYSRAPNAFFGNSLSYDGGPTPGGDQWYQHANLDAPGSWYGRYPTYVPNDTIPSLTNWEDSLVMSGPSTTYAQPVLFVGSSGHPFPAGSRLYMNRVRKRGTVGADISYQPNSGIVPADFIAASRLAAAFPPGTSLYTLLDTLEAHREFALGLSNVVGATPARRRGWAVQHALHPYNWLMGLTGVSNVGTTCDGPEAYGGVPNFGFTPAIDIRSPGALGGDPVPTVEQGRDVVNSMTGYTALEEWERRQELKVLKV